jgi:glycosyltransferase involved in cell wall biosynthesis
VLYDHVSGAPGDSADASTGDRGVRAELAIPADSPIIGMVARIAPGKDYFTLIRAAPEILRHYPTARFLLVGDYQGADTYRKYYKEVSAAIDAAGLTSHFIFTGFRTDVDRLMRAFDVFVLCTEAEGLPLVILEAMGQEIPIVATAVDGIPEVVRDGVTGLLHERGDERGLANAIIALLADPRRAATLTATAREEVSRLFSFEQFATNLRGIYDARLGRIRERSQREADQELFESGSGDAAVWSPYQNASSDAR